MHRGERIRINGIVQGVGFRPAVWRIAVGLGLSGRVRNDGAGVLVDLWGGTAARSEFLARLERECPPLASITSIERTPLESEEHPPEDFAIVESRKTGGFSTGIPADAALCGACAAEVLDPGSRRYRYPFTNCTDCGPRLSLIETMPYDRPGTTMKSFPMCPDCEAEYRNPADRRFHAQPIACPVCGPRAWLADPEGNELRRTEEGDVIDGAAVLIREGCILAVKGLGGFQLVCDATDEKAVRELRKRKVRPDKPFAVMFEDLNQIRHYCQIPTESELTGPAAPIVLCPLHREPGTPALSAELAPRLGELGVMLPTTPLHLLLCREAGVPLVMTSGNRGGNPQCIENAQALADLHGIADYWLLHNRPISTRVDDSVLRRGTAGVKILRQARGFSPFSLSLPESFPDPPAVLALGGEEKSTFCLLSGRNAVLSQYIGDLESARVWRDFQAGLRHYQRVYQFTPDLLVIDCHPEYLSSKYGREWSERSGLPVAEVQHHHAHVVSCMAENGLDLEHAPVLGVVFDGLGYGTDGGLWGGEFLWVEYREFRRLGSLRPVPLLGGRAAQRQPWRNLFSQIEFGSGGALPRGWVPPVLEGRPLELLRQAARRGLNSPLSSSAGRLFDAAAAALLPLPAEISYEGQAAMELEALAARASGEDGYPFAIQEADGGDSGTLVRLDPAPMWAALFRDRRAEVPAGVSARKFHFGLARAVSDMALHLAPRFPIQPKVVLSGGVFQNTLLWDAAVVSLQQAGFEVLVHRVLSPNDGGLALGQALTAAANFSQRIH